MRPTKPMLPTSPLWLMQSMRQIRPTRLIRLMKPTSPMGLLRPIKLIRPRKWQIRPTIRLWGTVLVCPSRCRCCSHSPSQNIPQSLQRWRDLLGYMTLTINWEGLELPLTIELTINWLEWFWAAHALLEFDLLVAQWVKASLEIYMEQ